MACSCVTRWRKRRLTQCKFFRVWRRGDREFLVASRWKERLELVAAWMIEWLIRSCLMGVSVSCLFRYCKTYLADVNLGFCDIMFLLVGGNLARMTTRRDFDIEVRSGQVAQFNLLVLRLDPAKTQQHMV
jgi:hypothetical protein